MTIIRDIVEESVSALDVSFCFDNSFLRQFVFDNND
ncbi:hypothetical protein DFA_02890 [Cavenderia fasciculata]|uniref:Uncharacterized protein n=1 Tax=Cavenderia fasciculata TaxID=261658 RepID=F4PIR7_CACFS|nr:uncharacterized protein DFA_02890 [Cavenderia fasciculata]EGG24646.1 hypothetical protein DFA_02890 [Cavenderia fasciculata]|eukprot:XP_004362497.1 hypothetical protein DFA_02890 [Cavenderia fasciculata]